MPRTMDDAEWRAFVSEGTRTGKLATTRHDGRPHVVPIWFVLDGDDFVFNTGAHSIKGRALARNGHRRAVRRRRAPAVRLRERHRHGHDHDRAATTCAAGPPRSARATWAPTAPRSSGERNAVEGELLVRLHADHVLAQTDIAGYE